MIPEYRLIHPLLKLKGNDLLKKEIKKSIAIIEHYRKYKVINLVFDPVTNSKVFNNIFSVKAKLENLDLPSFSSLICDFNLILSALKPVFKFQLKCYKHYKTISKKLLNQALKSQQINQWYQEGQKSIDLAIFNELTNNKKVPKEVIEKIKLLTHISGKVFQTIKNSQEDEYKFGCYFMLFYLIQLETKQTSKFNDTTNWNLNSYFNPIDLFTYKLKIIKTLNDYLMKINGQDFNLYWRIINHTLNNGFN